MNGMCPPADVLERLIAPRSARHTVDAPLVAHGPVQRIGRHLALVHSVDVAGQLVGAVLPHVGERRQPLRCRLLGQPRDGVREEVLVVLVDRDGLARVLEALEVLADAELAVGVDAEREVDPELVLLPHLAGVRLVGPFTGRPCCSANTRRTGWRNPIQRPAWVS